MSQGEISGMEMRPKCVVDRDALGAGSWVWPNRKISFIGGDSPNAGDSPPGYLASLHFDQTSVSRDHTGRSRASAIPRASGHSLVLRLELLGRFYSGGKLWGSRIIGSTAISSAAALGTSWRLWGTWRLGIRLLQPRVFWHAELVSPWLAPWPRRGWSGSREICRRKIFFRPGKYRNRKSA